jgi:hypothetical protein
MHLRVQGLQTHLVARLPERLLYGTHEGLGLLTQDVTTHEGGESEVAYHLPLEVVEVIIGDGLNFLDLLLRGVEVVLHQLREIRPNRLLVQLPLVAILE